MPTSTAIITPVMIQNLLGIGLSENTAIVVKGDTFEVIGAWKVAVHDNARVYQPWEKPYYVLSAGDVYNMKTRRIEKLGIGAAPPNPATRRTTGSGDGREPAGAPTPDSRKAPAGTKGSR